MLLADPSFRSLEALGARDRARRAGRPRPQPPDRVWPYTGALFASSCDAQDRARLSPRLDRSLLKIPTPYGYLPVRKLTPLGASASQICVVGCCSSPCVPAVIHALFCGLPAAFVVFAGLRVSGVLAVPAALVWLPMLSTPAACLAL